MITLHSQSYEIDCNELATLKHLAIEGALDAPITVSTRNLSKALSVSTQTISRRLRELESAGLISREIVADGQRLTLTSAGTDVLMREFEQYQQIFNSKSPLIFKGTVTDGLNEARHYISLDGYKEQFKNRLGYEPYPGTLNVTLSRRDVPERSVLEVKSGIDIDSWSDDERTYGAATCYAARVEADSEDVFEPAHVLVPDRTHHGEDAIEIIGPVSFRDELELTNGDHITIHVTE
ncbi:DUF120 domain-containing protein [Halosolutus amylolyticus]|uniref:Riboflavin kinase n=1 Tax=Halosolutus amylolyticus TaxID=2932267 RepID=A0ABD5PIH3_9EURY|nr:DUF120 domain-containing protein [Halosolutus amylolyticus]